MSQPPTNTKSFAAMFTAPLISEMLALSDTEFEHFIEYVFQRAGYDVHFVAHRHDGRGIDLELWSDVNGLPFMAAIVQVKKYTNDVEPIEVRSLKGTLTDYPGAKGYLVTTADFTRDARRQSETVPDICLIGGRHLVRYITYIKDSKAESDQSVIIAPECIQIADTIQRRSPTETKILAIANNKGGIGKTTTTINMAHVLDFLGKRVLVVDLDAQGNLSYRLPPRRDVVFNSRHFGTYLSNQCTLAETIRQTNYQNIWLIPSHPDVRLIDPGTNGYTTSALNFAQALHASDIAPLRHQTLGDFDWIILDTPTAVEYRVRLACAAAHYVIIPTQVETFAITGINLLQDTIAAIQALTGANPKIIGALITDYHGRGEPAGNRVAALRNGLNSINIPVFKTVIHHHEGIETAHFQQTNLFSGRQVRGQNAAAREYFTFVEELIEHVSNNR